MAPTLGTITLLVWLLTGVGAWIVGGYLLIARAEVPILRGLFLSFLMADWCWVLGFLLLMAWSWAGLPLAVLPVAIPVASASFFYWLSQLDLKRAQTKPGAEGDRTAVAQESTLALEPSRQCTPTASQPSFGLTEYRRFARAINELCAKSPDLATFSKAVRDDPILASLRIGARAELRAIYRKVARHFGMPDIPLHLPVRKKIQTRGLAFHQQGMPTEIRVYPLEAPRKPYETWEPSDLRCSPDWDVLDTVIHESAHVLEALRFGEMTHGPRFKQAYAEIAVFLKANGLEALIDEMEWNQLETGNETAQ